MEPPAGAPAPGWPGPSLYTLLAWVEVELLLAAGAQVDAAHAVVTDGAELAFGRGWVQALCAAAEAEGVPSQDGFPDLAALRADEDLAQQVLGRIRAWMDARDGEPERRFERQWSADRPDR